MKTEMPEYANLFKANVNGGLGSNNVGEGGSIDMRELAKDPAKYREAREKGLIP